MFKQYSVLPLTPGMKILLLIAIVWSLIWKGIALWKAARNNSKPWFVVLLLLNTLGILDIIYIYGFSKKNNQPV